MKFETLGTVTAVGIVAYMILRLKNNVIPDIAGFVDNIAGTAVRSIVVPPGPNALAVEYWQKNGIDQAWFMEIARGQQTIPAVVLKFLPDTVTVGMVYNAYFSWAQKTTIGDLERFYKIGLPGSSDNFIVNLYQYADAILWKTNELELIYQSILQDNLWDVVL
jgi:hypothetical protein